MTTLGENRSQEQGRLSQIPVGPSVYLNQDKSLFLTCQMFFWAGSLS